MRLAKVAEQARHSVRRFWGSPATKVWLRRLILLPAIAVVIVLLYPGRSPLSPPVVSLQMGEPRDAVLGLPDTAIPPSTPAEVRPSSPPPAKAAPEGPVQPDSDAAPEASAKDIDPVATALAGLPPFQPDEAVRPVLGAIVRTQGWYRHPDLGDWRLSPGVQILPAQPEAPVCAAYAGVVTQVSKEASGASWSVAVSHRDEWVSEYRGLAEVNVNPYDPVGPGSELGRASPGDARAVSFVLRHHDTLIDPAQYLP